MAQERLPSLRIVSQKIESEREAQRKHFESLDSKAGVSLGFAGVLVTLGGSRASAMGVVGAGLAAGAALVALSSFFPRRLPMFDPRRLRDYARAEQQLTALYMFDSQVEMMVEASRLLDRKARLLTLALAHLAGAILVLALAALLR